MEYTKNSHNKISEKNIEDLIKEYMAFIVKTVSAVTGRYVSLGEDDEISIALLAFKEAVDKHDETRGEFSSFAKLVITSRVKSYLIKENKHNKNSSIEELKEVGIDISNIYTTPVENTNELAVEIHKLKNEINNFGFSFEDLVEEAPKHEDTRDRAIKISEDINEEEDLKSFMYEKRRLPIKQISLRFTVTEKILKRSKRFIIAVVVIIDKKYRNLSLWIKK